MRELGYDRASAVEYARVWAFKRNPAYLNFDDMGGDCTNFASQCLYAGGGVMNPAKDVGWYYYSGADRAAAWTGVEYLHRFLTGNRGLGPYAAPVSLEEAEPGDLVQLGSAGGRFYHSPVVVARQGGRVYVAAHSNDAYMRPLDSYAYARARVLHIAGVRG